MPEGGPLPVTLISFTGKNNGNGNQLSWKVENEQNLNYYELQRSSDGQNFKVLSQIKAVGKISYTYDDPIAAEISSMYFYRLKSVGKDGSFKYSEILKLTSTFNVNIVQANPNPFKDKIDVTVESPTQDKVTFVFNRSKRQTNIKRNQAIICGN